MRILRSTCAAMVGVVLAASTTAQAPASVTEAPRAPRNLRCEYLVNPLGLDESRPRFSWEIDDPRTGAVQTAYEIEVREDPAVPTPEPRPVWMPGKFPSRATCQIEYAGKPLEALRRYAWRVRTFDGADHASPWSASASFGMGFLGGSDLKARWIGDAQAPPPTWPANRGYRSAFSEKEDDYRWVQLDLGEPTTFDRFRLVPARERDEAGAPTYLFPLQFKIWVGDDPTFKLFMKVADRTDADVPDPGAQALEVPLGNQRYRVRYVRLGVSKSRRIEGRGCAFALAELLVLDHDRIVSAGAEVTASDSTETGGWSKANLDDGVLESRGASGWDARPPPMLRRSFAIEGRVARATLYASALGLYGMQLNGTRVGADELAPGWTDYRKRVPYQACDVTGLVRAGDNAIAAQLADGWYAGRIGLSWIVPDGPPRGIYGRKPKLIAQLELEMADGTRRTIATDASWKSTTNGPVRSADLLDGETYDARAELSGWDGPGFDDGAWTPVEVAADPNPLASQTCEPVRILEEIQPIAVTEPRPGVFVLDLGQNFAGWCRISMTEPAGTVVTLRHAEVLDASGAIYAANLRGAAQTDRYTCRGGGRETFEPRFTSHGFRYVEVTGLAKKPELADLVGCVVSNAAPEVGAFECSDTVLTKLWRNIGWTQRANMTSVPTDCPQRDERLGWMGDIQIFAQTACFQRDMTSFFTKWLEDVRDAQADDGRYPDFAPHPYGRNERFTGTPGWGDAGVIVPYVAWLNYGDKRLVERHIDSMDRWIRHVEAKISDGVWRSERGNDYGDWLNGDQLVREGWPKHGGEASKELIATAFAVRSSELHYKLRDAPGKVPLHRPDRPDFAKMHARFQEAFVKPDGTIEGDTQAGYALALAFDLLPEPQRPTAVSKLKRNIVEAYGGHLSTGFLTTADALLELSKRGEHELAVAIATRTDFPSWGYAIEHGATTLWERWDGFVEGRGFQDPSMNSFDHYAFGSVGEWMMRCVAGLELDEDQPGWQRCFVHPRPTSRITWARGRYHSIRGTFETSWKTSGDSFVLDLTIPPNTGATLSIPCADDRVVIQSTGDRTGLHHLFTSDRTAVYDVPAGTFHFTSKLR